VSLTGQLRGGALADWCVANVTGTGQFLDELAAAAKAAEPPVRPAGGQVPSHHWATTGGAFGQRLAFLVQPAPPYYALLGTHRAGLADWATIQTAAAQFPTHAWLPPASRARACQLRPTTSGWLDLETHRVAADLAYPGRSSHGTHPELIFEFISRLVAYLHTHAPTGQLATAGAEAGLAGACWVLTGWEDAYRTGELAGHTRQLYADPAATVADLHTAAPPAVVDELVALATRLATSGTMEQLHALAGHPPPGTALGVAGPVFIDNWADGDLLVAGPDVGGTLLDVKTVMSVRDRDRAAGWLHQLLSYAWLDRANHYEIHRVGIYLARHGALVTWPVGDFATTLLSARSTADIAAARASFRSVAARVIAEEGGDPTTLLARDPAPERTAALVQQILDGHFD